ncbi:hypothetical protein IJG76_00965 [Candidatus Saccharibacteria bacterium]|nr:hypothetical protein [Candidatus Saccharibacteria bacterium]
MKKPLKIVIGLVVAAGIVFGAIKLTEFIIKRNISVMNMSVADFLVYESPWARSDNVNVIWEFQDGGKGKITSGDGAETYDMTWKVEKDKTLTVKTTWYSEVTDVLDIKTDREKLTFTITNPEDESRAATFVRKNAENKTENAEKATEETPKNGSEENAGD